MSSQKVWWYAVGQEKFGPLASDELVKLARNGTLMPDMLVWRDGYANWVRASKLRRLWEHVTEPASLDPNPPSLHARCRHRKSSRRCISVANPSARKRVMFRRKNRSRFGAAMAQAGIRARLRPMRHRRVPAEIMRTRKPVLSGPSSAVIRNISDFRGARVARNSGGSCCLPCWSGLPSHPFCSRFRPALRRRHYKIRSNS